MPDTSPASSNYVPPEPAVPLVPGMEPVPGYKLVRKLGKGGSGEVWLATSTGPGGVQVAIKFVTLSGAIGKAELRSLNLLSGLRHANLLQVFGTRVEHGRLAVTMELADGTLLDRLKEAQAAGQSGIPGQELLGYLWGAAAGLDYLHGEKLQHRDVKPQNLLLVGGAVKVADFGLAKLLEETAATHTGYMTPEYAPPEFFKKITDRHSDQYSLAVTYCQLRGGELPFTGDLAAVMFMHLEGQPDLTKLPSAERPVVARALAKEPNERWASCGEFAREIEQAMTCSVPATVIELSPQLPTRTQRPTRRRGLAVALILLSVVATVGIIALLPSEVSPPPSPPDNREFVSPTTKKP